MKKLAAILMVLMMAVSLSACSSRYSKGGEKLKVKCPACGYEFETEKVKP
jgi:predicted Zn-ribbon and HTH transcriptional regulator